MSTVITTRLDGVTRAEYDGLRAQVGWDRQVPSGMRVHVASFDQLDVLWITEVWDSVEQRDAFARDRVNPALDQLSMTVRPELTVLPTHLVFMPTD